MRSDFPLLMNHEKLVFLDNASTTQKPKQVIDAISEFYYKSNANIHRSVYPLAADATAIYNRAHDSIAKFINAKNEEIIFTSGTTHALNLVMYSWGKQNIKKGDRIVISSMEHHANLVPWQQLALEKEAEIVYIPLTKDFCLDMDSAKELINEKTKLVTVTHISNVMGTINDVKTLAEYAHNNGAYIVVDGAQAVAHTKVDVKDIDCDFYAFSSHKMYGPMGIGVLYTKTSILENMQPLFYGGDMVLDVSKEKSVWNDLPHRFEGGTQNIAGAAGLIQAVEYLKEIGFKNIRKNEEELIDYAIKKLSTINELTLFSAGKNHAGVISFTLKNIHPHDIATILGDENVCIRAGHHCAQPLMQDLNVNATCRISLGIYNTKNDIDLVVKALKKVIEVFV